MEILTTTHHPAAVCSQLSASDTHTDCRWLETGVETPLIPRGCLQDWVVLRCTSGPSFPLEYTTKLTRALRNALMKSAVQPPPDLLTGHKLRHDVPHAAFLALAGVGNLNADGIVSALAIAIPEGADPDERRQLLTAVARWDGRLYFRNGVCLTLEVSSLPGKSTGRPEAGDFLKAASRRWSTVTPVALDRHPGRLDRGTPAAIQKATDKARTTIALACERQGLPRPIDIDIRNLPFWSGTPTASSFPAFPGRHKSASNPPRVLTHVGLNFDQIVKGPIILGAGRHYGLGLFAPDTQRPTAVQQTA